MSLGFARNSISGDSVVASISVNISGQAVTTSISGQSVNTSVSGNVITSSGDTYIAKVSGEIIAFWRASGMNAVYISAVSGTTALSLFNWGSLDGNAANSATAIAAASTLFGIDEVAGTLGRLRVTASGSAGSSGGTRFKLLVSCSGDPVNISGNTITTSISGNSVLTISGSVVGVSGETIITSISGNVVQIRTSGGSPAIPIIIQNSGGALFTINSPNTDARSVGQNAIEMENYNMGFNESSGLWSRLRITASGVGGISGIGTKLIVDFSGAVATISGNAVTTSISGNAVIFSGQGVWISGSVATSVSGNAVIFSGQGVWVSGTVATSVSGNAVIFSGQGVWVSGTVITSTSGNYTNFSGQAVSVSGNAVTTSVSGNVVDMKSGQVFNNVFDPSGAVWRNSWAPASGSHAVIVSQEEPASYFVRATAIQITSGAHMLVMMATSGDACVKVKAVHLWPSAETNTVSGQVVKFDILRVTNTSGGGTAISAVVTDPRGPTSGINLTLQSRAVSGCAVQSTMLSYITTNFGMMQGTILSGQPPIMGNINMGIQQTINILNPAGIVDFGDVVVSSGFGMSIRQSTDANYTQVTSGQFDFSIKYTLG